MRWVSVLCILCAVLTGFSRNYLGVHTPQDVAVAMTIGVLALVGMRALFRYLDQKPEKELKAYPEDYVDGKLLVDPQRMMKDGYGDIGMLIAFCIGRFIEKTWVRFEPNGTAKNLTVGLVGALILFFLIQLLGAPMKSLFEAHWGCFAEHVIIVLYIVALWPAVMKACLKTKTE